MIQYPSDRELALMGQIDTGWSTLGCKLSSSDQKFSHASAATQGYENGIQPDEQSHIADVVRRAEVEEEIDLNRIKDLYKEHNMLCSNHIEDNKTQVCNKCGSRPRNAVACTVCQKWYCRKCNTSYPVDACHICCNRRKHKSMITKTTLSQAKCNARRKQLHKIIATSMEERSKRLQHLLKRSEGFDMTTMKAHSLPTRGFASTQELTELLSSTDQDQAEILKSSGFSLHRRRSSSTGRLIHLTSTTPACPIMRRYSSASATDCGRVQAHSRFLSSELPISRRNSLAVHRLSRNSSDADIESLGSFSDAKYLKRQSNVSSESIYTGNFRAQSASPTNHNTFPLSDNDKYLSDDGATPNAKETNLIRRYSLSSLCYFITEPDEGPTLEFKIKYLPNEAELHVHIVRCTGLREVSNVYVKMYIMSGPGKCKKLKTSIVHKSSKPEFDEWHTFTGLSPAVINKRTLFLVVVNHCRIGVNKQIGATKIPLRKSRPNEEILFRKLLESSLPTPKWMWSSELADRGRIYLWMEYCSVREALVVNIIEVAGLPSYKSDSLNPYVKCYLITSGQRSSGGHVKRKTKVMYKTTDPVFNEEIELPVKHNELHTKNLYVSVWDWNQTTRNINIGEVWINDCDQSWQQLIDKTDVCIRTWYNLTNPGS